MEYSRIFLKVVACYITSSRSSHLSCPQGKAGILACNRNQSSHALSYEQVRFHNPSLFIQLIYTCETHSSNSAGQWTNDFHNIILSSKYKSCTFEYNFTFFFQSLYNVPETKVTILSNGMKVATEDSGISTATVNMLKC